MADSSRQAFEAYVRTLNATTSFARYRTEPTDYKTKSVETAWKVWQAARQQNEQATEVLHEFSRLYGNLWDSADKPDAGFLSAESVAAYDEVHRKAHNVLRGLPIDTKGEEDDF